MDIIVKNPYRYLGVYSNSPTKERVANKGKMNAFLKVNKLVSFPVDFPLIMPAIDRTIEAVTLAEAELTLPVDQIKFAQFWWMNTTELDKIAFNHLTSGNIDVAKSIWEKKSNVSSLQNRFVLAGINQELDSAIRYAEILYTDFSEVFLSEVLGESMSITIPLWQMLLDSFINAGIDIRTLMDKLSNSEWKNYISEKTIAPLIETISKALDLAKSSKGKGVDRLQSGRILISSTKNTLKELSELLPSTDIRYQTIVDKLAIGILQCGIDYYNNSDEDDRAEKAMQVQRYAYTIAVGSMAKQRCKENVDILQNVIDTLPPSSVMTQYKVIKEELRKYQQMPDKIEHAIALLNSTKPHLDTMKSIVSSLNPAYIKLSTDVVGNALYNVIEEVNDIQKEETIEIQGKKIPISLLIDRDEKIKSIKSTLSQAWRATRLMDGFDMDSEFKLTRYTKNRQILKDICDQFGVSTSAPSPDISLRKRTPSVTKPVTGSGSTLSHVSKSVKKDDTTSRTILDTDQKGCLSCVVLVLIGGVIGGVIAGGQGAFWGALLGFFIWKFSLD